MATIHPSRLGLVPQSAQDKTRGRSPSPTRRSSYRKASRSRSWDRYNGRRGGSRDGREDSRERDRARDSGRGRDERDGYGSRAAHDDSKNGYTRRATPEYGDYKGPSDGSTSRQESMYPNRRSRDDAYPPRGGAGSDWLESRRAQRESRTVNIWPPSPKQPSRPLSPKRKDKDRKKSSKRRRYDSDSDSDTDSSEEERRRRKKEKKQRKEKEKESKRERKRHRRSRSRHKSYDDDEEEERERRERKRRSSRTVSRTPPPPPKSASRTRSHTPMDEEEEWVVKPSADPTSMSSSSMPPPPVPSSKMDNHAEDSDDEVGPQPAIRVNARKVDERSYGGALLRGEGSAMAAFLQDGDTEARIPRRGEIGLTSDEIAEYETVGYVMSGSRHRRMNAVRMRKENQVISAEERRGILKLQKEERERREAILREEFEELVKENLKGAESRSRSGGAA